MLAIKLTLSNLNHVVRKIKGKNGDVECLVIPIKNNRLFKSEKGNVYLDLIAFETESDYGSHIIKQSLSKEERENMTDDQKKSMPILGNIKTLSNEPDPKVDDDLLPESDIQGRDVKNDDDLPF